MFFPIFLFLITLTRFLLGSLSDYLRVHELSTRELFNIISTMAKGLAFLHSDKNIYDPHRINKPAIAHRDFKSKNVLLKQDSNGLLSAVISDFGLGPVHDNSKQKKSGEIPDLGTVIEPKKL